MRAHSCQEMKLYCFFHPYSAPWRPEAALGRGRVAGAWPPGCSSVPQALSYWRATLAPRPHSHARDMSANTGDGTRGAGYPHVKRCSFIHGQSLSSVPAHSSVPQPALAAALTSLSQGFEVSPAFCSRWHSLVLFQTLSFWKFLWENLF